MQLSLPWRYGKSKPFGSIPRINWSHPLAQGLVSYSYDVGGTYLDLVGGAKGIVYPNTNRIALGTSPIGGGTVWPGSATNSDVITMPPNPRLNGFASTAPYSIAAGLFPIAWVGQDIVTMWGPGFNFGFKFGFYTATQFVVQNNNSNIFIVPNILPVFSAWNTLLLSASGANAYSIYVNGKLDHADTQQTTIPSLALQVMLQNDTFFTSSAGNNGFRGMLPYHGCWKRALTTAEARQLHDDPYCFLIYPEDEMFATLVGTVIAPPVVVPPPSIFAKAEW